MTHPAGSRLIAAAALRRAGYDPDPALTIATLIVDRLNAYGGDRDETIANVYARGVGLNHGQAARLVDLVREALVDAGADPWNTTADTPPRTDWKRDDR